MQIKNIFEASVTEEIIERINSLTKDSQPKWGEMNVSQMLAHCNVTYEMAFTDKHKKPNPFVRFMLKLFVKNHVCGTKGYKQNLHTAPEFIMITEKEFEYEKERLIEFIKKSQSLGENHFDGKESLSFGILNKTQWNNMFYKHLEHHLTQFGV